MKIRIMSVAVAFIFSTLPFQLYSDNVTFERAWQLLQQQNNSLAAQRASVDRYSHLQKATLNFDLPNISVGANYTRLDSDITISGKQFADSLNNVPNLPASNILSQQLRHVLGQITSTIERQDIFVSSIRAIWPVFTGWRITAAKNAAQGRKEEEQSRLAMEVQAKYEDLSKYYFSVLLAKEAVKTRRAVERGLRVHRNHAIKLEQHAQIARVERLQAEASLDKAIVERKKAEKNLIIAEVALTDILDQKERVNPKDSLFINHKLPPLNGFIQQTLATFPGLGILAAKEKQAKSLLKAEQGKYYPEVFLYGNYNLDKGDSMAQELIPKWLVGVGVNLAIVENTGRGQQVLAAKSAIAQVRLLTRQARQDLRVLVEKTYLEAKQAIEEAHGLRSSIRLAKENLKLRQKAFAQGLGKSLDVIDAELFLASIRIQRSVASFHYLIALNKLLALTSAMDTYRRYKPIRHK